MSLIHMEILFIYFDHRRFEGKQLGRHFVKLGHRDLIFLKLNMSNIGAFAGVKQSVISRVPRNHSDNHTDDGRLTMHGYIVATHSESKFKLPS